MQDLKPHIPVPTYSTKGLQLHVQQESVLYSGLDFRCHKVAVLFPFPEKLKLHVLVFMNCRQRRALVPQRVCHDDGQRQQIIDTLKERLQDTVIPIQARSVEVTFTGTSHNDIGESLVKILDEKIVRRQD